MPLSETLQVATVADCLSAEVMQKTALSLRTDAVMTMKSEEEGEFLPVQVHSLTALSPKTAGLEAEESSAFLEQRL